MFSKNKGRARGNNRFKYKRTSRNRGRTRDNNRFRYKRANRNIRYRNRKLYIK